MRMDWPNRVAVIGAGYMGQGIAQVLAGAGCTCVLADVTPERARAAHEQLLAKATTHMQDGLVEDGTVEVLAARVSPAESTAAAVAAADLVIEAVFEDRDIKVKVLRDVASAAPAETAIATNTSSISIEDLAAEVSHPERFLGIHFFNPPQFVPGVEIIPGAGTDDGLVARVQRLLRRAGKLPAVVGDTPGFVANRLQYALFQEAAALVEEGVATPEAVDAVVRSTFGFRLPFYGPFAIADMAGLDIYRGAYRVLEDAYDDRFVAPQALLDLIDEGSLGAKTGRGFVVESKEQTVREGSDITLISTGTQTPRVVDAADILAAAGIDAHVVHMPTIKPIDVAGVVEAAEKTGRVVTIEEHTVIGGLGGAVAETLSEHRPTRVDRIGIQDHYTESATDEELLDMYCLSAERVAQRVQKLLVSDGPATSCE